MIAWNFQAVLTRIFARIQPFWQSDSRSKQIDQHLSNPAPPLKKADTDTLADLQREIRSQRRFSLAEAIGREGGGFMKGESTVPRPLRAATEVNQFITAHLAGSNRPRGDDALSLG